MYPQLARVAECPSWSALRRLSRRPHSVDSEDKARVEVGGLASLGAKLDEYIPDREGFERFGATRAFDEYVSYTLRPPYALMSRVGQKMPMSSDARRSMSFTDFLARQCLRDEAMASASAAWLARHPRGLLVGLVGINHAKFACGVPARTARMVPGGLGVVTSALLNPTPANTFVDPFNLRACDRTVVANEACLRNDIELQNYVLQVPYAPPHAARPRPSADGGRVRGAGEGRPTRVDRDEAAAAMQARMGASVLALADYVLFSPT